MPLQIVVAAQPVEAAFCVVIVPDDGRDEVRESFAEADRVPLFRANRITEIVIVWVVRCAAGVRVNVVTKRDVQFTTVFSVAVVAVKNGRIGVAEFVRDHEFALRMQLARTIIEVVNLDVMTAFGDVAVRLAPVRR